MTYMLPCKDLGTDYPFVTLSEFKDEIIEETVKHAKDIHRHTDEQINDPEMQ